MKLKTSNHVRGRYLHHMYTEIHKSLMPIIEKYDLNSDQLVDAFVTAWTKETAQYNGWTIRCRFRRDNSAMFLITSDDQVIAQFPIPFSILKDAQSLKQLLNRTPRQTSVTKPTHDQWSIGDLRPGMKSVTITGTIQQISSKSVVTTRWGTETIVANATISDGTGTILFSLWNAQIDHVHIGDQIEIRNGYTIVYRDMLQIRTGRKGSYGIFHSSSSQTLHEHVLVDSLNPPDKIEVSSSTKLASSRRRLEFN